MENSKPVYRLVRPYAGVCVKQFNPGSRRYAITYECGSPLVGVKAQTLLVELDFDKDVIVDQSMEECQPTGRFYRTAETHFPYHIVLDVTDLSAVQYVGVSV